MRENTRAAIHRHAARLGGSAQIYAGIVTIRDERVGEVVASVARDERDDRWVVAYWDGQSGQWKSSDLPTLRQDQGYRYTVGPTLRSLRALGIRSYATPAAALASIDWV